MSGPFDALRGATVVTVAHEVEVYTGIEAAEPLRVTSATLTLTAGALVFQSRVAIAFESKKAVSSGAGFVAALKKLVGRKITDFARTDKAFVLELERGARVEVSLEAEEQPAVSFKPKDGPAVDLA